DYGYYSVIYRTKLRKFIKKLKGKALNVSPFFFAC
ncbi:lipopolysaccharide core heptose(II) kinase RfaY, partial [Escherichia coli]